MRRLCLSLHRLSSCPRALRSPVLLPSAWRRSFSRITSGGSEEVLEGGEHEREARRVTRLGALVNASLAVSKGVTGFAIGSTGMIADAANSLGDLLMDIAVYLTVIFSRQGNTPDKPWGNGKIESIGALGVGLVLVGSGIGIGYSSMGTAIDISLMIHPDSTIVPSQSVIDGRSNEMHAVALAVLVASIASKEVLFRKTLECGQATNSSIVIANAWHHRSDALVSLAVGAGLIGGVLQYPLLDPLVGVLVSGILVHQGIFTIIHSLKDLGDRPASPEETAALRATCLSVDGIETIEHLQARLSGPFLFVDCTVGVSGAITASAAHRLSELAKEALLREHSGRVADVIVHVDPIGQTGLGEKLPQWARHHSQIVKVVKEILHLECSPDILDVSDVQVYYKNDGSVGIHLEVVMQEDMTITQANMVARHAKLVLQEKLLGLTYIDIDLELDYHPRNHEKFRFESSYQSQHREKT